MHTFKMCMILLVISCGSAEEQSSDCRSLIDDEKWQDAINCFEEGSYAKEPAGDLEVDEYLYLLQWAGAFGGKYGLIGSNIIDGLAGEDEESESSLPIDITAIITAQVEEGTLDTAISDMQQAIALITAYPQELRELNTDKTIYYANEISFIGLLYTSFLVELQKKDFEISLASGDLSSEQLLEKANQVIATLQNGGQVVGDPELASAIEEQLDTINSQPGGNNAERLEELLGSD